MTHRAFPIPYNFKPVELGSIPMRAKPYLLLALNLEIFTAAGRIMERSGSIY